MKLLILFAFVACAAADSHLFDPATDSHQICKMCGDPVIRTYDGAYLMVTEPTKTLLTQFDMRRRNPCKFQVRCVTMDDYWDDDVMAPLWIDWCGVSFWTHTNQKEFFRNWMFGQNLDIFGERGQGNNQVIKGINAIYPDTRKFPWVGEKYDMVGHPDYWHPDVLRPKCNPHPYEAYIDDVNDIISFRSNKECCGWAVDFFPRARDTCVNIYAEDGNEDVEEFKTEDKRTEGLCGNMDGNIENDWRKCFLKNQLPVNDVLSLGKISRSCKDGNHEAQHYRGGTKLDKTSDEAGFPQNHP